MKNRIFDRLKANDINNIKLECLDLIGMCYASLGQKPDKEQMKGMAQLFYNDLIQFHSNMTMEEVAFAINKGLRKAEDGTSVFINVRTWSVWLKDYKQNAIQKRRLNQLTDFQLHNRNQKAIAETINKAKLLK
tara:strand:- start:2130 stop:2528 length:399 start_codon:yes stop_codon:yes gene_type:complete